MFNSIMMKYINNADEIDCFEISIISITYFDKVCVLNVVRQFFMSESIIFYCGIDVWPYISLKSHSADCLQT